ncbi:MAG: hypothetical protein D6677_05535 [Calditrichaeota bacterium]|nr:MAG: hypothetical protein D6677_05535 [Calditrichota bacterium]
MFYISFHILKGVANGIIHQFINAFPYNYIVPGSVDSVIHVTFCTNLGVIGIPEAPSYVFHEIYF